MEGFRSESFRSLGRSAESFNPFQFRVDSLRVNHVVKSETYSQSLFSPVCKMIMETACDLPSITAVRSYADPHILHTYEDLSRDALGLAYFLKSQGIGIGDIVALAWDRSYGLIVCLLAVWLSGAAYLCLDPAYPEGRIKYILKDSNAAMILTTPGCHHLIPESFKGAVIDLDPRGAVVSTESRYATITPVAVGTAPPSFDDEICLISPGMLACLWYTSGTTGYPKGVLVTHGAFAQAVRNVPTYPEFGAGCTFGQISSPCYPGHVNDLWKPLTMGATVAILPKDALIDPETMGKVIERLNVSSLMLTPKVLEMFADLAPNMLSKLKLIQFAGERVRVDAVLKLASCLPPGTILQHLYGCSENCSIISCFEIIAGANIVETLRKQTEEIGRLPAGHPVAGVHIYILDPETLEEVPNGESGEVCISGNQVSPGYHNRSEDTNMKFKYHPVTLERIYCTGDVGCMAPYNMGLDVMGRINDDGMIKFNGIRIELGGIEAAAVASELQVKAAAAVVFRGSRLVLYVAPSSVDLVALKNHLKSKLASYCVPSLIEALPSIPLNVSGKVDRSALPEPVNSLKATLLKSISIKSTSSSCRTSLDGDHKDDLVEDIVHIFSEILNITSKSITPLSSFTGLSGHSLQAMVLLSMLRSQLSCPSLQLFDILEDDCPRHIASVIERYRSPSFKGAFLPNGVQCVSAGHAMNTPVWVLPGGQGRPRVGLQVGRSMNNRPMYAIELTEEAVAESEAHPVHRLDGLVASFIKLIKAVQPLGPYIIAGNRIAYTLALTMEQSGDEVLRLIIMDDSPFWFNRKEIDAMATERHNIGLFGLVKYNVLVRTFPNDPDLVEKELDRFERAYHDNMPTEEDQQEFHDLETISAEVGQWLGYDEGRRWHMGLKTIIPLLNDKSRLCARPGQDILKAPIMLIKATESMHKTVVQLQVPNGLYDHSIHDYGWGSFTSAGSVHVDVLPGNHFNMGDEQVSSRTMAKLFDSEFS